MEKISSLNNDLRQFMLFGKRFRIFERKKIEKEEELSRSVKIVVIFLVNFIGVIPKRYVRSHIFGLLRPHANYDSV